MKLHLPKLLRNAVLACITAVAGISTTVGTATVSGITLATVLANQQAVAATLTQIASMDQLIAGGTVGDTVVKTTGTGYTSCKFDGQSAITNIASPAVLEAITSTSTSNYLTVAAWVKPAATSGVQSIFSYGAQSNGVKFALSGSSMAFTTKGVTDCGTADAGLVAGEWTLVAITFCLDNANNDRYLVGPNDESFFTRNFSQMNAPAEAEQLFGIGTGNCGNMREAFTGEIQNLTIFTSDGLVNNSAIAAIMGTVAPSEAAISWLEWNTASADNTWGGANWQSSGSATSWSADGYASFSGAGESVTIGSAVTATQVRVVGEGWAFTGEGTLAVAEGVVVGDGSTATSLDISNFDGLTAGSLYVKNAGMLVIGSNPVSGLILQAGGGVEIATGTTVDFATVLPSLSATATSNLIVSGADTVLTTTHTGATGFFVGNISVKDGATLELKEFDALGYSGGATSKITIQNGTLGIGGRITCNTDIDMKGNAVITTTEYSGTSTDAGNTTPIIQVHKVGNNVLAWTVSGTGNTVESGVKIRMSMDLNINVADAGELLIKGTTDQTSKLTKSGAGVLALSGNQFSASEIEVTGGSLRLDGNCDRATMTRLTNGHLTVGASSTTSLSELAGYGTVTVTSGGSLTLNRVDVAAGQTLAITGGATTGESFAVVGAGALQIDTLNVTSALTMNGVNMTVNTFNIQAGSNLIYSEGDVLNISGLTSAVNLNVYGVVSSLSTGIDTGIAATDANLDTLKGLITVLGYDSADINYSIKDGHLWVSSDTSVPTDWDINWGSTLADAPATVQQVSLSDADYTGTSNGYNLVELAGTSYASADAIVVELTGASKDNTVVVGGLQTSVDGVEIGDTIEKDVWIKATGGSYKMIAGGSWNAWGDSSTAGRYLVGDTHILVDGANVTNIIGSQFQDDTAPTHTGDTYISVVSGTVEGSILGSGGNCHSSTLTQTGDTNIYIYTPLITADGHGIPTSNKMWTAVVAGGSAHVSNEAAGAAVLNGNTNITIDIDDAAADALFDKTIVGGHFSESNDYRQTLNGNTNVTIDAENVSFAKDIVAGSYTNGSNPSVITGSTNLVIKDGVFTSENKAVYGGSFHLAGTGAMNVGSANVTVEGGTIGTLVGGSRIAGTGDSAANATIGDITVTVTGGEVQNLIGGSSSVRGHAASTINQGNIVINLQGGTVGDVYAAGSQQGSTKLNAASTQVSLGSDVTIAAGKTISGGYKVGEGLTGSTVTGSSTIIFSGAQDRSSVNFNDFSTITAADAVKVGSLSNAAAVTKNGAGILTLAASTNALAGGLTVSEGGIATSGATTLGGALTLGNGTSLDMTAGIITLTGDNSGALTLGNNIALNVAEIAQGSSATIISGFSNTDLISGEVAANTYFSSINGSDQLGNYILKVEGNSLVLVNAEEPTKEITWDAANSTWKVGSKFGSTDADTFADGDTAIFGALSDATEEVTIDGAVNAASVSIAAGADKEYSFVSANSGQLTTSTLEIGAGTAKFGAGSLNVAALETIAVDGVLDLTALDGKSSFLATASKATGEGTIKLTGGWWQISGGSETEPGQFDLGVDYEITGDTTFNFGGYTHGVVNINSDVTIDGFVSPETRATINVDGGNLTATEIKLGHAGASDVSGHVILVDGSIKAGAITRQHASATGNTFTMTDGTLELTGTAGIAEGIAATISGGTIKTGANSWSITGAEIGGATIETGEGTITLNGATITSQLDNTSGKVALAGTINVDTTNYTPAATSVTGYSEGENGYQRTDSKYMLVSTVGNLSVSDVTWQVDGATEGVSYADGGVILAGTYGTEFYLRTVDATYSNLAGDNHAQMTAIVLDGKGLNLDVALREGVSIKAAKEGQSVVAIGGGIVLNAGSVESDASHQVKLHGAGTYALADGVSTLGDGVVLGDWTGTVKVTGAIGLTNFNVDTLAAFADDGTAKSTVELTGVSGHLTKPNVTYNANLKLTNDGDTKALTITNGWAANVTTFAGAVSGSGSFAITSETPSGASFQFTGNLSQWDGAFEQNSTRTTNLTVASTGTVGADIIRNNGTLNVTFSGADVVMNGDIGGEAATDTAMTNVTIASGASVVMNGSVLAKGMTNNGTLSLAQDISLTTLSNTGSLTATGKSITAAGAVTGAGSISAGALTLQAATNTVGALTLSGDLTLGTADATSVLTATSLTMGAADSSVVLNKLGTNLLTVGTLGSALNVSIADSLLEAMIQDGTSSLELMTLTDIGSNGLSLNGEAAGYGVADGQYLLTLDRDETTGVVTLVVTSQGSVWGGTGDDADNLWSSASNWNGGVVPGEDESVVFDGRGSSTVVIDGEIMVENLTFATNTDTTEVPEPVTEYTLEAGEGDSLLLVNSNMAVNNGSTVNVATEVAIANNTRIANGATLTVNEGGTLRSNNGIENNGTINNNYDVIIGSGVSVGSATADTLTNNGTFNNNAEGVLTVGQDIINSGTLNNAGELSAAGALDNSGSIAVTDGTVTIGVAGTADDVISLDNSGDITVSDGVVTINGSATNEGGIAISGGEVAITGSVMNTGDITISGGEASIGGGVVNTGDLTVSGGEASIGGNVANQGNLTVSSGELAIEGSVDNTNGDISIGSEGNTASMTVGGDLVGTGATDKLTVEEGSSLAVGGDLTAADVALEFGGDVTVGGMATVGDLAIAENASFAAANATIGDVANDGTLTVGTVDATTGELVGGELNIDSLSGSGDVAVGKDGVLNIDSMTEFSGQLTGEGTLNTGDNAFVLESRQEGAASITAGSLEITEAANGSVIDGKLTTDEIVVEKLSGSVSTPVLTTSELAAKTTDGKITLVLSEVEAGTVDSTSSTLLICVEEGMTGTLADNFDLSRYGYDANGEYDAGSTAVQSDYMQELLGKGLIVRFSETEPIPTTSLLTAGSGMDVYAQIDNQSADEATWDVSGDRTNAGYIVGTNTNGNIVLNDEASLDNVQIVNVDTDATIDITGMDDVQLNNVYSANGSTLTVVGGDTGSATMNATALGVEGASVVADSVELTVDGSETQHIEELTVQNGSTVYVDGDLCTESIDLSDADSALVVNGVADTVALNGTGELVGELIIVDGATTQPGNFTGTYTDATVWMDGGKQTLAPGAGLTVAGDSGTATLAYDTDSTMDALATTGATVVLDRAGGTTLELTEDSSMYKGQLKFGVTADEIAQGTVQVIDGNLDMEQTRVTISIDSKDMVLDVDAMGDTLAQVGTGSSKRVSVELDGDVFDKYFTGASMVNGAVVTERNESYYSDAFEVDSKNGNAGLALANAALLNINPQATNPEGGLAKVLDEFDKLIETGDNAAAEDLGAALAGASTAVLGVALQDDVERQLKAIRNRTTTMGVDQTVVNHDMPYFNAWINAEGDHRELSDDGTAGGYTINSWGGTVGFDVDICPTFTAGLALTAMYGDLDVSGADEASGDMDTYYVSAFARYCASAWTHTFVATAGLADLSLDRTVMGEKVTGESDAISFGLMYEVGRVFALNEDATACLQPIFNVSWRHTEMEGYQETGSDLGLTVGDQTLDTVTFGLGARLQAVVGESMYNRTSIFECRVLAKADVGDRQGDSKVGLAGLTTEVESAEVGAFGLEAGAGLTIPLGDEGSSIFMDASVELRADYTNVNGTVGYRINF